MRSMSSRVIPPSAAAAPHSRQASSASSHPSRSWLIRVLSWPTILSEEKFLRGAFGAEYDAYCARVPRFLPKMSLYVPAVEVTVGIRAFRRVLVEAGLMPLAFIAAQGVEYAHQTGLLPSLIMLY